MTISLKNKDKAEVFIDGVYEGLKIANNLLKEHNLKISTISKKEILKKYIKE